MTTDYFSQVLSPVKGELYTVNGVQKKYEEMTIDERNIYLYKSMAKDYSRPFPNLYTKPAQRAVYYELMEVYDPPAFQRHIEQQEKLEKERQAKEAERIKREEEAYQRALAEAQRQYAEQEKRRRQAEAKKTAPTKMETHKAPKLQEPPKSPAKNLYTQEANSPDVKKAANQTKRQTTPGNSIEDDYNKPREKKAIETKRIIDQTPQIPQADKKLFKGEIDTFVKVDAEDPASLANMDAFMKNAATSNREIADKYQAEAIKKYVPALKQTTGQALNEAPKNPATTNNSDPSNGDLFQDEIKIIDKDWITSRFLVPNKDLMHLDAVNRFFSTAGWKYASTQLGTNVAMNAKPQFTRYCDIRGNNKRIMIPGMKQYSDPMFSEEITPGICYNIGMGRYYSEAIDDNATLVYLQFGMPKFNSLLEYFVRAITYEDMYVANHGCLPRGYALGKFAGMIFNLYFFPLTTIVIYGYKALFSFVFGGPLDYYYFNDTMPHYWSVATTILNKMAIELGIIIPIANPTAGSADKIGSQATIEKEDFELLAKIMPNAFYPKLNFIDLTAIAARPQAIANNMATAEYLAFKDNKKMAASDYIGYITDGRQSMEKHAPKTGWLQTLDQNVMRSKGLFSNIARVFDKMVNHPSELFAPMDDVESKDAPKKEEDADPSAPTTTPPPDGSQTPKNMKHPDGAINKSSFWDTAGKWLAGQEDVFDSAARDGLKYAVFQVDFQGSASESFSSSSSDIELAGALKGAGGAARNVKFNTSGGNLIPGMGEAIETVKGFVAGALESVSFGLSNVISTLLGNAYLEFPKKWDDSEISLPQITYNIKLISPYGNAVSQLQNIYIPLAMLLAGSLPLAAGERSYTSPFLCRCFNKGVQNIKLGMITSLNITRGTSNLPFSRWKKPLALDVSFTVTDFSTMMAAPVNTSPFFGEFNMRLEDGTKFDEYIGVLCGKDLLTDMYFVPKLTKKVNRLMSGFAQTFIGADKAASVGDKIAPVIGLFTQVRDIGNPNQNNQIYY